MDVDRKRKNLATGTDASHTLDNRETRRERTYIRFPTYQITYNISNNWKKTLDVGGSRPISPFSRNLSDHVINTKIVYHIRHVQTYYIRRGPV